MVVDSPLHRWDVSIDRLPEMREALRRRKDYPAAAQRLAANIVKSIEKDPALAGLLKDAGRIVTAGTAAQLGLTGGITLVRLKATLADFGLTSPGRARAGLQHMLHLSYIERDYGVANATSYRLTPAFLATYTYHQASILDAVAVLEPDCGDLIERLSDPTVLATLVTEQIATFSAGSRQASPYAAWFRVFMHRLAGTQILHAIVAEAQTFPPRGPVVDTIRATASRFGVSRAHVTRILNDALAEGFIVRDAGELRFTAAGLEALDWLYANRLCVYLACAARTLRIIGERSVSDAA